MGLSENIKRLRLEKGLTQEALGSALGISAQAVSKWETSGTYPDGSLLVPLAKTLEVSLDVLFDNDFVSMPDLSQRIMMLLQNAEKSERFSLGFDIAWQIERSIFYCDANLKKPYIPNEFQKNGGSSYLFYNDGFTVVSSGKEPFFSFFPEPEEGFGDFVNNIEEIQSIFAALSHPHTMDALLFLYHKPKNYLFAREFLAENAKIPEDQLEATLEDLLSLRAIWKQETVINGESCTLYRFQSCHKLFALLLLAKETCYLGRHSITADRRKKPLLKT